MQRRYRKQRLLCMELKMWEIYLQEISGMPEVNAELSVEAGRTAEDGARKVVGATNEDAKKHDSTTRGREFVSTPAERQRGE